MFDKLTAAILCTFVIVNFFLHKFLQDLQSFHCVFKIPISKNTYFCCELLIH